MRIKTAVRRFLPSYYVAIGSASGLAWQRSWLLAVGILLAGMAAYAFLPRRYGGPS